MTEGAETTALWSRLDSEGKFQTLPIDNFTDSLNMQSRARRI